MKKLEFMAMGCAMTAFLDQDGPQAARVLAQAPVWFEEWEQALSRFRPDSELNQLNSSAGKPFEVGRILWDVIQAALWAAGWSGGLVVPSVLNALEQAGYDRTFDLVRSGLGRSELSGRVVVQEHDPALTAWQEIRMDETSREIWLPAGARLDLGGIAKGWAAREAMRRLREYGPALMDSGGDIAASGLRADGSPWAIGVADPLEVQENLGVLAMEECGVATSGIDYRRWLKDGAWKHHIIDPRSGQPAETDLLSVTAAAPDLLQAEAAAKTALILGSDAGLNWLDEQPRVGGLLALQDGQVLYSTGIQDYLWS